MAKHKLYYFLQKQILVLIIWSFFTGFGYTILCYIFDVAPFVSVWFGAMSLVSLWGWILYGQYSSIVINYSIQKKWYTSVQLFIYAIFGLWTALFLSYADITSHNLNQVTVLIQTMASVLAATFLFSDKKIFIPVLVMVCYPLVVYFINTDKTNGYFLAIFTLAFLILLLFVSSNGYRLIQNFFHQAQEDALTKLYNRHHFVVHMEKVLQAIKRRQKYAYVILIDLDYFKHINDTLGSTVGDKLLCEIANRLRKFCAQSKHIARLGGDKFIITSSIYENEDECIKSAENFSREISDIIKKTYLIEPHRIRVSASIGIKLLNEKSLTPQQVIKETDMAMDEAKTSGRDGIVYFDAIMSNKIGNMQNMERKLYFALEHKEIEIFYQPQIDIDNNIYGCEALVRWYNPDLGKVTPLEFIALAEKTGIIIDLGNYIIEESFKALQEWQKKNYKLDQLSINISIQQLLHENFIQRIEYLSNKYLNRYTKKKVVFEITESILQKDINSVVSAMKKIKDLGIGFSLDDFGTGYASLSYLQLLPIDELKIDRSIVNKLNVSDKIMLRTVIALADIFNLRVIAEGVETKEQLDMLKELQCRFFQGYYFDKPLKKEEFEMKLFKQKAKNIKLGLRRKKINRKYCINQ